MVSSEEFYSELSILMSSHRGSSQTIRNSPSVPGTNAFVSTNFASNNLRPTRRNQKRSK